MASAHLRGWQNKATLRPYFPQQAGTIPIRDCTSTRHPTGNDRERDEGMVDPSSVLGWSRAIYPPPLPPPFPLSLDLLLAVLVFVVIAIIEAPCLAIRLYYIRHMAAMQDIGRICSGLHAYPLQLHSPYKGKLDLICHQDIETLPLPRSYTLDRGNCYERI